MKISRLRKQREITQSELAQACGSTQQQIAKIESSLVDPKLSTLRRLAAALDCELKDLFWSKKDFLKEVNETIKEQRLNVKKLGFAMLGHLCMKEKGMSSFHPFWEEMELKNNRVFLRRNHEEI